MQNIVNEIKKQPGKPGRPRIHPYVEKVKYEKRGRPIIYNDGLNRFMRFYYNHKEECNKKRTEYNKRKREEKKLLHII